MKKSIKYFFIVLLILNSCSSDEEESEVATVDEISLDISDEILRLINAHREGVGLSALKENETTEQLAIDHTNYMISIEDANHDDFQERGAILRDQENATSIAENVAQFYPDAASVVAGWLESGGHRDNIEGNFTHTGIAAIRDGNGRYYYTQVFYR